MKCNKAQSSGRGFRPCHKLKRFGRTLHRILDRRPGQQKAVTTLEVEQDIPSCACRTFDSLSLIQDHVLPLDALEIHCIRDNKVVARDDDMEARIFVEHHPAFLLDPELPKRLAFGDGSPVRNHAEVGNESSKFLLPVVERRCRCYYKEWAPYILCLRKMSHQCN